MTSCFFKRERKERKEGEKREKREAGKGRRYIAAIIEVRTEMNIFTEVQHSYM